MKKKSKRGFASPNYDQALAKKIQSMGGKASKGGGRPKKSIIKLEEVEVNHEDQQTN